MQDNINSYKVFLRDLKNNIYQFDQPDIYYTFNSNLFEEKSEVKSEE